MGLVNSCNPAEYNCGVGVNPGLFQVLALPGLCGEFYGLLQVVTSYLCGKQEVWLLLGKGFTSPLARVYYRDGMWGWDFTSLCWSCLHTYFKITGFVCLIL